MGEGPLRPWIDEESAPFFEGARRGELRVQRCTASGRLVFPPRALSPFAPGAPLEWVAVSGRGTIWSFVVPHPPLLPFYAALAPYNVIAVALEEDPTIRLVGNLVPRPGAGPNAIDPASIRIGAAVRVVFEAVDDELTLPRWVPA
jgi:uncharacterized OB-fold protein